MKIHIAFAACVFAAGMTTCALAGEIGRVEINGNEIILNDDNTWEYSGEEVAAPAKCTEIESKVLPVSVCLDPDTWVLANLNGAEEHGFHHKDKDVYVLMITEKQVIDQATLKKAVLANAQNAAGLNKVDTLEDGSASVDGHSFGRIVYRTIVDGIDVTYANYYTSFEGKGTLQIVAFAGSDQFDEARPVIAEVIAGVSIKE
jgi:hypothetical protein